MIIVDNVLISDDLISGRFCCDLSACKGMCCVEGDLGAPLEPLEVGEIEEAYPSFQKYLPEENIDKIEEDGLFDYDPDGHFVTPLLPDETCVYCYFEEDIAKCAIEKAFLNGETDFQKPISCHLYPIRIKQLPDYEALNYHRWFVCESACEKGEQLHLPVFRFLKEPLIRKYGEAWYEKLERAVLEQSGRHPE